MVMFKNRDKIIENSKIVLLDLMNQLNRLPVLYLDELKKEETALVIVDLVNGFVKEGFLNSPRIKGIVPSVVELLKKFKERNMTVIAFADTHTPDSVELKNYVNTVCG